MWKAHTAHYFTTFSAFNMFNGVQLFQDGQAARCTSRVQHLGQHEVLVSTYVQHRLVRLQLLHDTTWYYMLLHVTTCYYMLVHVTVISAPWKWFDFMPCQVLQRSLKKSLPSGWLKWSSGKMKWRGILLATLVGGGDTPSASVNLLFPESAMYQFENDIVLTQHAT